MCYPKPGPRCSPHAREQLQAALLTGDTTAVAEAQHQYNLTPAGIKELRVAGKTVLANRFAKERKELIAQVKANEAAIKPIRVGVDIDNTMMDFTEGFRQHAMKAYGLTQEEAAARFPDPAFYKYVDAGWFETGKEFLERFSEAEHGGIYRTSKAYANVAENLRKLVATGKVEIHVVTARDSKWNADTVAWLDANNIPYTSVTHTDAKENTDMDIYIDDADYQITKLRAHGKEVIAFDQLYNANMPDLTRVKDWQEMPAAVRTVAKKIRAREAQAQQAPKVA